MDFEPNTACLKYLNTFRARHNYHCRSKEPAMSKQKPKQKRKWERRTIRIDATPEELAKALVTPPVYSPDPRAKPPAGKSAGTGGRP